MRHEELPQYPGNRNSSEQHYYQYFNGMRRLLARARSFTCPVSKILSRIPRGATHLDIGCGTGLLLAAAVIERGTQSVGCELSRDAVAIAADFVSAACGASGCAPPRVLQTTTPGEWPPQLFEVITIIDVLHHVTAHERANFLIAAAEHIRPGGVLIYKDIAFTPRWMRAMNTLHDLVLAQQLVSYMPIDDVIRLLMSSGLELKQTERFNVLWYANELAVLQRSAGTK